MIVRNRQTQSSLTVVRLDEAGQRLVDANRGLAVYFARQFAGRHTGRIPWDDLVAEALLGLIQAASHFDPSAGVPFRAYAGRVVPRQLTQFVRRWRRQSRRWLECARPMGAEVELPLTDPKEADRGTTLRVMCGRIQDCMPPHWYAALEWRYARGASLAEVGEHLGVTRQRAHLLVRKACRRARERFPDIAEALGF